MSIDINQVLSAFDSALSVIKTVANTPGVNVIPYASAVSTAISLIQAAEAAGKNSAPFIAELKDTFSGGVPTPEKIAATNARLLELGAEIDVPLPPPEKGEDD